MKTRSEVLILISLSLLISVFEPVAYQTGPSQPPVDTHTLYVAHAGWGPSCADPIQAVNKYDQELIFNCYDTLITMGNPIVHLPGEPEWAVYEQYWAFQPSLAANVPSRSEVFLAVPDNGMDPDNPVGYWFENVPPDGRYYRIETWDCNDLDQSQGGNVRTETSPRPEEPFALGEIIVGFENISASTLMALREAGGQIVKEISALNVVVVDVPIGTEMKFLQTANTIQGFKYAEPNCIIQGTYVPNDPDWNQQWNMRIIEADKAWDINKGDANLTIAIIDTGVDYNHTDLAAHYVPGGYDWVNNDNNPMDDNGHGTHCAGIAAGVMDNSIGVTGVAQCGILAEKVLDNTNHGTCANLASAIIHATDMGAKIISMSLGWYEYSLNDYFEGDTPAGNWTGDDSTSAVVKSACEYAWSSGVLLAAAAGNDNTCIDTNPFYPACYDTVIAVSATTSSDKIWMWSPKSGTNWGSKIELAAPGEYIYSTTPGNSTGTKTGTSMACPHVAGVAALAWSQFPSLTNLQLRKHLHGSVDDLGDPGKDAWYGYGRTNARKAMSITPSLSSGDLLYVGEYAEMGNVASIITVRAWHVVEYLPNQVLRLQRWYYDFCIRTVPTINFVDATGTVVDVFDIYDVEYSFERGLVQDAVPIRKFYQLLFNQMDSSYWDTGNPADAYLLAYLIEDAVEITSLNPPILRINIGTLFSDMNLKQMICGTWSSIMSKEWCIGNGCWNDDLLADVNYDGYPDWWSQWRKALSPIRIVAPENYVGSGPYRVTTAAKVLNLVVLDRNTLYWKEWPALQRKSFVDIVDIEFIGAQNIRTNSFIACQVDICDNPNATDLLAYPMLPVVPLSKYPEIKAVMLDATTFTRKWLKYWVKGWYYNAYYPSDYYYHLYKEQTCWADVAGGPEVAAPDGIVNMRDIAYTAMHFGAHAPSVSATPSYSSNWAPGTYGYGGWDVFGDRRIDMRDIGLVCSHFNHGTEP